MSNTLWRPSNRLSPVVWRHGRYSDPMLSADDKRRKQRHLVRWIWTTIALESCRYCPRDKVASTQNQNSNSYSLLILGLKQKLITKNFPAASLWKLMSAEGMHGYKTSKMLMPFCVSWKKCQSALYNVLKLLEKYFQINKTLPLCQIARQ